MSIRGTSGSVKVGDFTRTVYSWIRDGQYKEAILFLNQKLMTNTNSRAGLSLLGYCYFMNQDYLNSLSCYQQLSLLYPQIDHYKLHHAQCLYQLCNYTESLRILATILDTSGGTITNSANLSINKLVTQNDLIKLQAAIKYEQNEIASAKVLLERLPIDDIDREINLACLLYKQKQFENALQKFNSSFSIEGYKPDLSYNIALCHYKLKQYLLTMKFIGDIIERGIREHPELSVGLTTEGIEVRSVGNTITLHETALVEAFNLKAAIEFNNGNLESAQEALTDMPPRSEEELDAVTLHNLALISMDADPVEAFEKMQYLIQQNSFPPETFANLLLLYCKYEYYDLAADVMAEYASHTFQYLSSDLYEFLDAIITQQTSPEEAYTKFDVMSTRYANLLVNLSKQLAAAEEVNNQESVKKLTLDYDKTLQQSIPVLMAQAKIFWDLEIYNKVETVFAKFGEFCNDNEIWKLNVAHVLFMQENKFKEATGFYEPIVKKNYDNILSVSAIVLANLCVSYIMTNQNENAEELMRKIEKEEEQLAYSEGDKKIFHLCIVNLVIGTLYCAKGNYEFGITRVIKSLEPYNKKLGTDTWFYAKRCFLSLLENMAKQTIIIKDSIVDECIQFLIHCEKHGKNIKAVIESALEMESLHPGKNTVAYESRLIRALLLQIM